MSCGIRSCRRSSPPTTRPRGERERRIAGSPGARARAMAVAVGSNGAAAVAVAERHRRRGMRVLLAVASGMLLGASFPSLDLEPLAWIGLVPLLLAVAGLRPRAAFGVGWLAGF